MSAARTGRRAARRAGRTAATTPARAPSPSSTQQRPDREGEGAEALVGVGGSDQPPADERPDAQPADGAEQRNHDRLAPHDASQLATVEADRPEEPELPGALVDRQRQRAGDAEQGDDDGHRHSP